MKGSQGQLSHSFPLFLFDILSVYWLDCVMGHEVHRVCSACTTQPIRDSANQGSVLTPDLNIPITASVRNRRDGHLCSSPVKVIDLHLFNYK